MEIKSVVIAFSVLSIIFIVGIVLHFKWYTVKVKEKYNYKNKGVSKCAACPSVNYPHSKHCSVCGSVRDIYVFKYYQHNSIIVDVTDINNIVVKLENSKGSYTDILSVENHKNIFDINEWADAIYSNENLYPEYTARNAFIYISVIEALKQKISNSH